MEFMVIFMNSQQIHSQVWKFLDRREPYLGASGLTIFMNGRDQESCQKKFWSKEINKKTEIKITTPKN